MRPGDMDQWEVESERAWRGMMQMGIALVLLLAGSMLIGIGIGWLIWGI